MGIKPLPTQYSYTCDACGNEHIGEGGAKFENLPSGWSTIIVNNKEVDNGSGYKRTGREEFMLCPTHASDLNRYLEERKNERRTSTQPE